MELFSWSGDYGLASLHPECLAVQTYLKMTGAPVHVHKDSNNPFWTPRGDLPVLRAKAKSRPADVLTLTSFDAVVQHLAEECQFSADHALTAKQRAETTAFRHMIKDKLEPAMALALYVDPNNYEQVMRPFLTRRLPFPLSFYYPGRYQQRARQLVQSCVAGADAAQHASNAHDPDEFQWTEQSVYASAEACLDALSDKLADRQYLLGGPAPTSLDAVAFSYLAPALKAPLPRNRLQNLVKARPNLTAYVARISAGYFPLLAEKPVADKASSATAPGATAADGDSGSRLNVVLAVATAVAAMAGYGYASGLLGTLAAISRGGHNDEEEEYDDEYMEEEEEEGEEK